jgi:hypothetical protein
MHVTQMVCIAAALGILGTALRHSKEKPEESSGERRLRHIFWTEM